MSCKKVKIESYADGSMKWIDMSDKRDLTDYELFFEVPFLNDAAAYYRMKAQGWNETLNSYEYISIVFDKILDEERRAKEHMLP